MAFDFTDLTPAEEPIKGVPVRGMGRKDYLLCEAGEDDAAIYEAARMRGVKMNAEGKVEYVPDESTSELRALLLSRCVWSTNGRTPMKEIKAWPRQVAAAVFERAKEISGLQDEATKEDITNRIAELQKQLERLEAVEDPVKNSSNETEPATE